MLIPLLPSERLGDVLLAGPGVIPEAIKNRSRIGSSDSSAATCYGLKSHGMLDPTLEPRMPGALATASIGKKRCHSVWD